MKETLTTLLNSPVIASIIEALLVCFVISRLQHKRNKELEEEKALIQQDCDIRLEKYRFEFNRILSEDQIRFGYWYTEKAKAINAFYKAISEIHSLMQIILSKEQADVCSQEDREELYANLSAQRKEYKKEWAYLKLYFDKQEEELIECFISEENKFFIKYLINKTINDRDSFVRDGKKILDDISSIMEALRQQFQRILTSQSVIMEKNDLQNKTINQNGQPEQNSSAE